MKLAVLDHGMAARGRVPAVAIELLESLSGRRRTARGLARRAQVVLAAAEASDKPLQE